MKTHLYNLSTKTCDSNKLKNSLNGLSDHSNLNCKSRYHQKKLEQTAPSMDAVSCSLMIGIWMGHW